MKKAILTSLVVAAALVSHSASAYEDVFNKDVPFPESKNAWLKGGTFVNVEQLRRIGVGMSPNQVRELISYPHFNEGFGLSNWNYVFNFRTGQGDEFVTCQYQVQFKNRKTNAMYWNHPDCEGYAHQRPPAKPKVPRVINVSADGLFAFGRSDLGDLQTKGRENLAVIAGQIKSQNVKVKSVRVLGYTDRIGSQKNNLVLSRKRAESVKRYFIELGIDPAIITAQGLGAVKPVVTCPGASTPKVRECLMPNRRIEVTIDGE